MSERPPGVPEGTIPPARESAVVVLARKNAAGLWEVLMGLRSRKSAFFPHAWAFPGGGVEPQDDPPREGAHARCAVRELMEETGIRIPVGSLTSLGIRTTPPFHPLRYRTEFFIAPAPAGLSLSLKPEALEENEEFRFLEAIEALEEWEQGRIHFPPPLPPLLRVFARESRSEYADLPRLLGVVNDYEERVPRIEFSSGIWMYPVYSATLPPATHTNVWIPGGRRMVIIDPGTTERWELDHLEQVIQRRRRMGVEPVAVILTHHHQDHTAGAGAISEKLGIPIRCHPETADILMQRGFPYSLSADLNGGAVLDLGGLELVAQHTPGHAAGHLAFMAPERRVLLAGDLVSGFSSIFIHPDEGDMGAYLESLRRVGALEPQLLLPAHGPPLRSVGLAQALAHRQEREDRIFAALSEVPRSVAEIAREAYADAPEAQPLLSELQTRAHLRHLVQQKRATEVSFADETGWIAGWREDLSPNAASLDETSPTAEGDQAAG